MPDVCIVIIMVIGEAPLNVYSLYFTVVPMLDHVTEPRFFLNYSDVIDSLFQVTIFQALRINLC